MKKERFFQSADRYLFDFKLCRTCDGWAQLDTTQDAWYFGNWINPFKRQIVTYAEGDVTIRTCDTDDEFRRTVEDICLQYEKYDGQRPGIDPGFNENLKTAFVSLGLQDWLH